MPLFLCCIRTISSFASEQGRSVYALPETLSLSLKKANCLGECVFRLC